MIRSTAEAVAAEYGPEYWREKEEEGEFAQGSGTNSRRPAFTGCWSRRSTMAPAWACRRWVWRWKRSVPRVVAWRDLVSGSHRGMATVGIRENGTEAQKERYLPDIAAGERNFSIGITEPEAGTNTLNVATRAEKDGDEYVLNGNKAWISFADRADNMILVTRTTPRDEVDRGTDGISLFIVDMDDPGIDVSPILKHGINYSKSCEVFIEDVRVPEENLLGEKTRAGGRSSTC